MKHLLIAVLIWTGISFNPPEAFICKNAKITIFSSGPLEDIDAKSEKGVSVFDAATGDLVFSLPIRSLTFQKSLMQEHFNEEYLESDKYPTASFKGKVQGKIDVTKDGDYSINVVGILEVHGVKQNRTIPGKIIINGSNVSMSSTFNVLCKDHNVEIPTLLFKKIAESIQVQVNATYVSFQK